MPHLSARARLLAACAFTVPTTGMAADGGDDAQTVASLSPVVVTATRTAQTADDAVAPVTVIDREEIERSGGATLPDLLAGRPGIDISRDGGFGKSSTINLRGLGNGQVLFLIDGTRISDTASVDGAPSIQHIPTAQIERIEIVRGPRSTLYGSQALGGVINIITRQPDEAAVEATAGAGSYSTRRGSARISGRGESLGYSVSVGAFDTDGYDIRDDAFDDDDGYDNTSLSGRIDYDATDSLQLSARLLADEGTTEFDNCFDQDTFAGPFGDCRTDYEQRAIGVGGEWAVTSAWTSKVDVRHYGEHRRNFYQDTFNNEFKSSTTTVSWQNDVRVGSAGLVTLGLEDSRDEVEEPETFAEDERQRTAAFVQWQRSTGAHDLVIGVRGIDDEQFGSHTVGSIDYAFRVVEGLRLLASAGTAFRAPSLFQLYSSFGNDQLDAEESTSIEFGIAGDAAWGSWSARTYRTRVDNLIDFVGATSSYANVADDVEVNGLEVDASANLRGWDARVSYSWSEPVNESTDTVLPNKAERSFGLSLGRAFGPLRVGGSIEAQSSRSGSAFSEPVAGYGILNLDGSYRLAADWRLRATLENVGDKEYELSDQYLAPGRTGFVYLDYRPGSG